MKAILIIGLIGLATMARAQEVKCVCVKKTAHHTSHIRTTTGKNGVAIRKARHHHFHYAAHRRARAEWSKLAVNGCAIDSNGDIQYLNTGTYMGNYPASYTSDCDIDGQLIPRYGNLVVTSTAFENNGTLPAKYTCKGEAASPPLHVANIPQGAVSLAVIMFDPHATSTHSATNWLIWNLDPDGIIPENFATDHQSESRATHRYGYQGACANDGTHYFHIRVYALDTKLLLDKHTTMTLLENTMRGHVLAKGELICQSNRRLD